MLLIIETATAALSLALIADGAVLAEHHEVVGRGHAERLLPAIAELLGKRRPDAVAVDCGPGSFTGVRVGLAAAQGLRIAWGVPVYGVSSTALIAARHGGDEEIAVALNGGHGEVFIEMFDHPPLRASAPLASLRPEAAALAIPHPRIVGSGAAAVVAARGWGEAVDALPRAGDFVRLPPELTSLPLRPIYGRAPDAKPLA